MARKPPTRPIRRLTATAVIIIALYSIMGLTGHTSPKLGLDLKGGTTVTLLPKAANGTKVTKGALNKAVDILRQRINGLGVAEADVVVQNNFIVISVPGRNSRQVVDLVGRTARLTFREVLAERSAVVTPTPTPRGSAKPSSNPSASPKPGSSLRPSSTPAPSASVKKRVLTANLLVAATASPQPSAAHTPAPAATPTPVTSTATPAGSPPLPVIKLYSSATCAQLAAMNTTAVQADGDWVVACDRQNQFIYLLKPAQVVGTDVSSANATIQQVGQVLTNDWIVNLNFTSKGQAKFTALTKIAIVPTPHEQVAVVLDGVVQSAPTIQQEIDTSAQISGNFTQKDAEDLANVLKFGALPLDFEKSQAQEVSASLGKDSLKAGLLAGALGLALVILYCFLYYRAMGIVTVLSLSVSGLLVFASVTLLGQLIGFTLTLAGIAGLIVSVGITADSFVVFYERLKDEVREGRTVRSSVDRGWVRARRTIISADFVSILAAVALYLLSVGSVRGFAFTLGLSTLLDLVVVFVFTKPLVSTLVRFPLFATSKFSGLSVVASSGIAARKLAGSAQSKEA